MERLANKLSRLLPPGIRPDKSFMSVLERKKIRIGYIINGNDKDMEIILKQVTENEIEQLQEIGRKTFFETFAKDNARESMDKYLEESFSTDKFRAELQESNSEFYFALQEHDVIGYLKLNTGSSQTEDNLDNSLEIERIYVLKEFHGKKAGQILFQKALEIAIQKQVGYIWLGVWENNDRAIAFYRKNGFEQFDKHIFRLGDEEQTDILMKRKIR